MPTYPDSIDGIKELQKEFKGRHFPKAKEAAHNLITFPVYSFVTQNDKNRISALISKITNRRQSAIN
jgi:dTDP-4-amino-4,6-dideoxygalactose transaminase